MTVSNSSNYNQTRDQIISDVFIGLGVYRPGATISAADTNYASSMLNKLVKSWEGQGIHMWTNTEGTVFLRNGVNQYTLSSTSSDNAGDNVVETTLTASASNTGLTVSSTVGMSNGDNIGIVLDNNTTQWTTIVTVNSSTSLTITASLTSTASSGNNIYTYTTALSEPLHISSARFRNSDGTDRPVFIRGRDEFMQIPSKTTTGKINQLFYTPNLSSGAIYVWPTPDSCADRLKISYTRRIYDFNNASDTPDLPSEWLLTLTLNLEVLLAPAYGRDLSKTSPTIIQEAQRSLQQMQLWDTDSGSLCIVPNYRYDE